MPPTHPNTYFNYNRSICFLLYWIPLYDEFKIFENTGTKNPFKEYFSHSYQKWLAIKIALILAGSNEVIRPL